MAYPKNPLAHLKSYPRNVKLRYNFHISFFSLKVGNKKLFYIIIFSGAAMHVRSKKYGWSNDCLLNIGEGNLNKRTP